MQLHQFLRFCVSGIPIILFDIAGIEICKVYTKEDIHVDLYEYPILELNVGFVDLYHHTYGLMITLQK